MGWFSSRRSPEQEYEQIAQQAARQAIQAAQSGDFSFGLPVQASEVSEWRARLVGACYTFQQEELGYTVRFEQVTDEGNVVSTVWLSSSPDQGSWQVVQSLWSTAHVVNSGFFQPL